VHALAVFEPDAMAAQIRWAAEIHLQHIAGAGDPFETGSARPLDFGHWAAHKLEALTHHALRHGEAVAIGMALDCRYATRTGLLPAEATERVCTLLETLGFCLHHPALDSFDADETPALLAGLSEFREHLGGELTVTLLQGIGRGIEVHEMDPDGIVEALSWLRVRSAARCA
jgi:3-dehydroquinate synthase